MKVIFKRITNVNGKKTVSFAPRNSKKLDTAGIELITLNGIEVGSWNHMKKINRPDLQYWPVDSIHSNDVDADFYVLQQKKMYRDAGYEILPVKNYEDNF